MQSKRRYRRRRSRRGASYVLALVLTTVMAGMSMAMVKSSGVEVRKAINQRESAKARLAAESGVAFVTNKLKAFEVSGSPDAEETLVRLATFMADELPNGTVSVGNGRIMISGLNIDSSCGHFTGAFYLNGEDKIELEVEGQSRQAKRNIALAFELVPGGQGVFSKGIVTAGPFELTGNSRVTGANATEEAQVLTLSDENVVYDLTGNSRIEGDIFATNPAGQASLTGNVSIGGVSARDDEVYEHIHFGVDETEIPRPDPSLFEPFATNVLSGPTGGNRTFTNIRIPANTNPTFAGNINLRGVIYVEYPNNVRFSGNLNLKGVIVTQDPGASATDSNKVRFTGNTSLQGVETLPDSPEFSGLRSMPGSSVLAPGFEVTFTGNFGTVGGTLAAEKFTFHGNASATVKGSIFSLGDDPYRMTGNARITIDRSDYDEIPPGFSVPSVLASVASSYVEY